MKADRDAWEARHAIDGNVAGFILVGIAGSGPDWLLVC